MGFYGRWMDRWERKLATRDTNRVVRPFEWGTEWLHRIDPALVKQEAMSAGFVLAGESQALHHPEDNHTAKVFALKGKSDRFLLKFRKPRS